MSLTTGQLEAIRVAVECIEDAAAHAGPLGAPSGIVYLALSEHGMKLDFYTSLLESLVKMGRITVEFDCIHLVKGSAIGADTLKEEPVV